MNRSVSLVDEPLLKSRFRKAGERIFFGRARLYRDRIVLSGWTWTGRYQRIIRLEEVVELRWWSGEVHSYNMVFYLHDGTPLWLWLSGSGLWKYQVEECLGLQAEAHAGLPGVLSEATAA